MASLLAFCRTLTRQIDARPATTNEQRSDLWMTIRDREPSPAPVPLTRPVVEVEGTVGLLGMVRLHDELTPTSRRRPDRTLGALLHYQITAADAPAPASAAQCTSGGLARRTFHAMPIPAGSAGKALWVLAQWVSDLGDPGPISEPARAIIAA